MLVAVAAVLLGGAGVVAVMVHEEGGGRQVTEAFAPDDVTTTTSVPETATTTSTTTEGATTTSSPPTTGATTATTLRPTTTVRPPATARPQTTTTAPLELCAADQIDIRAVTDSLSYPAGQPVRLTSTIRNRSSTPCFYRGYDLTLTFFDPAGRTLLSSKFHADDIGDRPFAPGQSLTHTAVWDYRTCQTPPCRLPPPGIYSVAASWSFSGGRYGATMDFVVRAA